jgi:hypothetical protein
MKQIRGVLVSVVCVGLVMTWSAKTGLAADKANYTGTFSLQGGKTASAGETDPTLEVVQTQDSIDVTREEQGRKTASRCPLNGSDGDYTSPGGVSGKCKAELKGKYLILGSVIVTRPQPSAPPVRMHTKERWQLSPDSKTLTIRSDVDFPDFPAGVSAAIAADTSRTQKYIRTQNP